MSHKAVQASKAIPDGDAFLKQLLEFTTDTCNTLGLPYIKADWNLLLPTDVAVPQVHLSITHTDEIATAMVIIS